MTHISEIAKINNFDIKKEFDKIKNIFDNISFDYIAETNYGTNYDTTINFENLADTCFCNWKGRGTTLSIYEFKEEVDKLKTDDDFHNIILDLEYLLNIIHIVEINCSFPFCTKDDGDNFTLMIGNINIFLDQISHKMLPDKEMQLILLVPKSPEAIAVAEQTKDITMANAILKYNHYLLKGNLKEKCTILSQIYKCNEGFFTSKLEGYDTEKTEINKLINNLDIRHNNKTGKKEDKRDFLLKISDEKLEEWYDDLYQLMLFFILAKNNTERMKKFKEELDPLFSKN